MAAHPRLTIDWDDIFSFRFGSSGDDHLVAGNGSDVVFALAGNDLVEGGNGHDYLAGGAGNDSLFGGNGNDALLTGGGNDVADGGNGADVIVGGSGNKLLAGGHGNDRIFTADGNALALGGQGQDWLVGGDGASALFGGQGRDVLLGGAGTDLVVGGQGNDFLNAGTGLGALVGGEGRDVFKIGDDILRNDSVDRIVAVDFNTDQDVMSFGHGVQAALGDAKVEDITIPKGLVLQELTDAGLFDPAIQPFLDQVSDGQAVERDLLSVLDDLPDEIAAAQVTLGNGDQIIALGMSADGLNQLIG